MNESTAQTEMPRYRCHKEVHALKIGEDIKINEDGTITFSVTDPRFAPITVDRTVVSRVLPMAGMYYVVYSDGYKSFSPAKAFEDGYTLIP